MQIEDPTAPSGSLQEVLHPQDVERVNFDSLDEFLVSHAASELHSSNADGANAENLAL
jgi:hypothetical protein